MKWQEIKVTTTECMLDAVTNIFYEVDAGGVVIEDPRVLARYIAEDAWDYYELPEEILKAENVVVKGYLPVDEKLPARIEKLKGKLQGLRQYFEDYYGEIDYSLLDDEDWANSWKTYYKPHKPAEKIVVIPSWEKYSLEKGEIPICLDPGMAFGTGTHPTTELCIEALEKYLQPGSSVYDVGTGSGILAITAAKLGASRVYARDFDSLAVKMAKENIILNNVEDKVTVEEGNLLDEVSKPVQVITANIIADIILLLSEQAYNLLLKEGIFISCGIINTRIDEVKEKLEQTGFKILEIKTKNDWVVVVAQRK